MPNWWIKDHPRLQTPSVSFSIFLSSSALVDWFARRHIIHTVGPVYTVRDKEEKAAQLTSCYKTSLELAVENAIRHIVSMPLSLFHWAYIYLLKLQAFPSISTGIYSYPIADATRIALNTARVFLDSEQGSKVRVAFTRLRFKSVIHLLISSVLQLERVIFVVWSNEDKHVYEYVTLYSRCIVCLYVWWTTTGN